MSEVQLPRPVFILSDGTGDTGEKMVRAALHQFKGYLVHLRVFPNVGERDHLERLIQRAAHEEALLFTTLVSEEMRTAAQEIANGHGVPCVDLLGDLLSSISAFLAAPPQGVPGRMHQADEAYFRRVEAVEFTVKADDGKEPRMLRDADIVLVGVSRTSKTPLSVFLAHKGYKVSNVPIVLDRPFPDQLGQVNPRRIFALTIAPESLQAIRHHRISTMRLPGRSNYSEMGYILEEIDWAEGLFRKRPSWPVIDVTRKAVEETASIIIKILEERGLGTHAGEVGQL
jgi:regulator of PEP synthase PpsR (kinase-PPPase family)